MEITKKDLNLIAYLINEFAKNGYGSDNDCLNVIDIETNKRTKDYEFLNEINVRDSIGHFCEWVDEDNPNIEDINNWQQTVKDRARAYTTILAVDKLKSKLKLDDKIFDENYHEQVKYAQTDFNYIYDNMYLNDKEIKEIFEEAKQTA